jgi:hypothetical protein
MKMNAENSGTANTPALFERVKKEMPGFWSQPRVVVKWIWLEFSVPPLKEVRARLKELGFHWNAGRTSWKHPCGVHRPRCGHDRHIVYPILPAAAMAFFETPTKSIGASAKEYKIVALRECPLPESLHVCDTPDRAAEYWRLNIATCPYFNPECECFAVLLLNTRRRVKGHQFLTIGTLDTILVHPREVFRGAVIAAAAAIVLMHNHPSGEPQPSEADIKVTRDLIRAGQLLKIEVLDHVIVGNPNHCSLRALGYFP